VSFFLNARTISELRLPKVKLTILIFCFKSISMISRKLSFGKLNEANVSSFKFNSLRNLFNDCWYILIFSISYCGLLGIKTLTIKGRLVNRLISFIPASTCSAFKYPEANDPNALALETAATKWGVVTPPAIGA